MENKRTAILVLAIGAALLIAASATYAMMGRQTQATANGYWNSAQGYRMGPSMMGGSGGYAGGMMGGYSGQRGGMMGGYGMMGDLNGSGMYQYMYRYWNSTAAP